VGWVGFFGRFKTQKSWAWLIAAINLVGIAYGFYYYAEQFRQTPWYLWPFVPDSPLAVLWAELALLGYWVGRRVMALEALAVVGNVQVGLWTVYVLLAYAKEFRTYELTLNTVLLAGHAGMAVLALIYLEGIRDCRAKMPRRAWIGIGVAAAYYLLNDALDYFGPDYLKSGCGMRPYTVPCDAAREPLLTAVTLGLTLTALVFLTLATRPGTKAGREWISPRP
jgi:uncharacterized membrane protein YpjA